MDKTRISWADASWNPVTGCSEVSPGCDRCYAKAIAERYRGTPAYPQGFDVTLRPHKLDQPVRWERPRRIFVNSMSDLFHREIPDDYLRDIWDTMLKADQHIYLILTKRAHRMAHKVKTLGLDLAAHIWLGVSAENQKFADNRIPPLLSIGSATPWVSAEPLIGPIDMTAYLPAVKWCVVGGESGPGRRHMEYDWARSLRDQCGAAGVAFHLKQGNDTRPGRDNVLDGRKHEEFPDMPAPEPRVRLNIREYWYNGVSGEPGSPQPSGLEPLGTTRRPCAGVWVAGPIDWRTICRV